MTVLSVQNEFQSGYNVTATSLNNLVNQANFNADTTDSSTLEVHSSGYLKVKDNGIQAQHLKSDSDDTNDNQRAVTTNHIRNNAITSAKIAASAVDTSEIASSAVTTTKIADDAVTFAKLQNIATSKVIGRTTAGSGDAEEVNILDQDDMSSNSNTALATQQSIKAYVDNTVSSEVASEVASSQLSWQNLTGQSYQTLQNAGQTTWTIPTAVPSTATDILLDIQTNESVLYYWDDNEWKLIGTGGDNATYNQYNGIHLTQRSYGYNSGKVILTHRQLRLWVAQAPGDDGGWDTKLRVHSYRG